ncbi:unnamed protein product [marine sediment metagenome]|uniref:Uncharacterized protein n=1 Tax=marine sediment metagenome TaxID=412755 RepID=X1BXR7_9ZZZZ
MLPPSSDMTMITDERTAPCLLLGSDEGVKGRDESGNHKIETDNNEKEQNRIPPMNRENDPAEGD